MGHFWLVRNGICFHTIKISGYMEQISDIWNSVKAGEASVEAVDVVGGLVDAVEAAGGRIDGDSSSFSRRKHFPTSRLTGWGWWLVTGLG